MTWWQRLIISLGGWADYFVIVASLFIGMLAAFGRARHHGENPDRRWFLDRLLILPFLAAFTAAAVSMFNLSRPMAAFIAAFVSMLGYDAVTIITTRSIGKVDQLTGFEPAHRSTVDPDNPTGIGTPVEKLRDVYPLRPNSIEDDALLGMIDKATEETKDDD